MITVIVCDGGEFDVNNIYNVILLKANIKVLQFHTRPYIKILLVEFFPSVFYHNGIYFITNFHNFDDTGVGT